MLLFSQFGSTFFPAYREFSKGIIGALAAISSIAPFALWDWLAIPLVLLLVGSLVRALKRTHSAWRWLANTSIVVAAMLFFLVGAWGLNHYAPPLAEELELPVKTYSETELAAATTFYLEQAADVAAALPRHDDGALAHQDFYELARIAGTSYTEIEEDYPVFEGSRVPIKALILAGEPLLYWGSTGIFWPFTGEANVPLNAADATIPFTMCHEAAHRLGIASEQEANFAAFLACTHNPDTRFAYAGNLEAFNYCYNALATYYPERAQETIVQLVGENPDLSDPRIQGIALVLADRQATYEHYQAYEGPIEQVGTAANDRYLKTFSQEAGVRSYGLVTDYLVAWHQQQDAQDAKPSSSGA